MSVPIKDMTLAMEAFSCAEMLLTAVGHIQTFCVLENHAGQRFYLPSSGDRDEFYSLCRLAGAAFEARALLVIGESYKIDIDENEVADIQTIIDNGTFSDDPRVHECVSLMMQSEFGIVAMSRNINRDQPDWVVLDEFLDMEIVDPSENSGSFNNMLYQNTTAKHWWDKIGAEIYLLGDFTDIVKSNIPKVITQ